MTAKHFLFLAIGMILMYVILRVLKSKTAQTPSASTEAFKRLAKTGQTMNLVKTNEFRELVKTTEFRDLVKTLANDQVNALTSALL